MTTRRTNKSSYKVTHEGHTYLVTMTRIKNTVYGCPRFEFEITDITDIYNPCYQIYYGTAVYRTQGHYLSDFDECALIVKYHYNKVYNGAD